MNQQNALQFGRDEGKNWQKQTTFYTKAEYEEWGQQCAAYHARSEKAYKLFLQGYMEVWAEPVFKQLTLWKPEMPRIALDDPNVITLLAHYLLQ